jgi:predicted AlkP superfamily phosphohydrolase/phosphomutase
MTTLGKTLLIGLDGATFDVLDPLMARGAMPFLSSLVTNGVRAPLRTVIPALTPPGWTSLVTGKRPGKHGVFDFFRKEAPDSVHFRFASSHDVGAATIWSLATNYGKSLIALNFPLMFPPPAVNGTIVPGGWMPWRQLRLGCYPPGLFDRLKALDSFNAREMVLDMALEEKAVEGAAPEEYADWIALHIRRERRWLDILRYLVREEPADLITVLFDGTDKLQHLCWRFLDPATASGGAATGWEQEIRGLCEDYFRQLDQVLAETVSLAGPDASVLVTSDHGAGPTTDVFYVNAWLEQNGYLAWSSPERATGAAQPHLGFNQTARHVNQLDWTRTRAYVATPSSNGIHIVPRGPDREGGVSLPEYQRVRAEIAAGLHAVRHPLTGRPVVTEVWTREQVFDGPFDALGPDLTLVMADGGLVSILPSEVMVAPRPEVAGAHRPLGVLVASGPLFQRGANLAEVPITDVAPTLLYSLGIPIPDDLDGRLPEALFHPHVLAERPPTFASSSSDAQGAVAVGAVTPDPGLLYDAEAEATMLKRLRALGYVE